MPFTHAGRRGATVLFRRNVPSDLRDRSDSHEIVRSIGRATPGEARRVVHRLRPRAELVVVRARSEQGLTRGEVTKVIAAAVDGCKDDVEIATADVIPGGAPLRLGRARGPGPTDCAARRRSTAARSTATMSSRREPT